MTTKTIAAYDRWASTYDLERNPQIVMEHDHVVSLVDAHHGEDILDAACGTGKYTIDFHDAGARVIGVDASPGMLERAMAKFPSLAFKLADISQPLPFPNDSFDKVNCAQALKHISNLGAVFGEFRRVLRANGALVFSVTHPDMTWDGYHITDHLGIDTRTETDEVQHRFGDYFGALERAGLSLEKLVQIPVSEESRTFLTPASFAKVEGRLQVLAIRARRR